MSDVVDSDSLDVRPHWKKIARKDKLLPGNGKTLADICLGNATNETFYLLFDDHPYCFFEGGLYEMLPVEDPSIGYKLVDSTIDKKTLLMNATGITETQAIDVMFLE